MPIFGLGKKKSRPAAGGLPTVAAPKAVTSLPGLPEARLVQDYGDPELTAVRAIAAERDWPRLRAALAGFSGHDLNSLIDSVTSAAEVSEWLPKAVAADSDDALALTVLGTETVNRAWRVRTSKRAQHVSQEQFRVFHEILQEAEEHLYRSAELDPASAAPWTSLLTSGMGLQIGLEAQQRRFEAVIARCPGHVGAHSRMLQQLCRKWSGSHEQMHAFATDAMRGPHGDVLGVLVPRAYFEHFVYLDKDSPERAFIKSAEARAELQEAADRTVFRPGYHWPRSPYLAGNVFGWAFRNAGMMPQARAAFEATNGCVVDWNGYGDPLTGYIATRNIVYREA